MRTFWKMLGVSVVMVIPAIAASKKVVVNADQTVVASDPNPVQAGLYQAMVGEWTGVLEYRDYSEPATSTKRVFLPTWLSVAMGAGGLSRHFVYDDGPNKVVDEMDRVVADVAAATYSEQDTGKAAQMQHVTGYEALKNGRGDLVLSGAGTDDGKTTETRTTLIVRRNLVSWVLEVRPAGSSDAFSFRHRFTFTRANVPVVTAR